MVNVYYKPSPRPPGRVYKLIGQGLNRHPTVNLVPSPAESDYVFYMCSAFEPHIRFERHKVVHIDFRDPPRPFLPSDCLAYFKRSWVSSRKIGKYYIKAPRIWPANFHPISYAIMDEFVYPEAVPKDIDVGCYLRPNQNNRAFLLMQLFEWAAKTNARTSIGPVNTSERNVFDPDYLKALARTKILVTCNPDQWEGDSRTWEALANGCLVFVDELFALRHHPLKNEEHIIYFQIGDEKDLTDKLDYYLRNEREARGIAENGHRFAMSHHRCLHRIDEILNTLDEGKRPGIMRSLPP